MKVAERGIARAKIVQRNADAEIADLRQRTQRCLVIVEQCGFGDFEFEAGRGQARIGQRLRNGLRQSRVE